MSFRVFYGVQQVSVAVDGTANYIPAHGVQSVGITTNFNLQNVFEMGQVSVYEIIEQVPEIEVTMEKCIDGYPLLYHLLTNGATSGTLAGRSNVKSTIGLSVFSDSQDSASGVPLAEVSMSGMVVSSVAYAFTTDGPATESVTAVGNSKVWRDVIGGATQVITAGFSGNNDVPVNDGNNSGGVQKYDSVLWAPWTGIASPTGLDANGQTNAYTTVLPTDIAGVSTSGTNPLNADGTTVVPVQSINVSADLNRESIFELGKKFPYHKYVNFPVEVRTEIEVNATKMDGISVTEAGNNNGATGGNNTKYQTIRVQLKDGTRIDTGPRNRLSTVSWAGGDARQGGGNVTNRYSYVTQSTLNVYHPSDPSGL